MQRLVQMLVKELLQLRRDPKILPILFVAPIFQLLVLGYAATTDVRNVELAVCDLDHSVASRELVRDFTSSTYFKLVALSDSQQEFDDLLSSGRARLAMTIPHGFAKARALGLPAEVQIIADGSDAMVGTAGLGYAMGVLQAQGGSDEGGLTMLPTVLYNPDLISRNFMVPGILALILMVMTMTLSSMAIVREAETGTLEQLLVTPLKPGHIIVGKLAPYALIGAIEFVTALPIVLFWFEVPLRGALSTLVLLTIPFMLCMLGLGLLVSTISKTQQQAMMISTFIFMMPQIYLSGFIFPIQNMPTGFQLVTYAVPLRYYVTSIRGVFLKGVGLETLWPQGLVMFALAILILAIARLRFRRQVS